MTRDEGHIQNAYHEALYLFCDTLLKIHNQSLYYLLCDAGSPDLETLAYEA
jgi:hypothetical protein